MIHSSIADRLKIRLITPQDNARVASIIRSVMPEFGASGPGFAINDAEVDSMAQSYGLPRCAYWVVELDGEIVGGVGAAPLLGASPLVCELRKMYFLPQARGLGIGRRLLEHCMIDAAQMGFRQMYAESLGSMTSALQMYDKAGFKALPQAMGNTGHFSCDRYYLKDLPAPHPVLQTDRLTLRALSEDDAEAIHLLANDFDVASGTRTIPHPFSLTQAKDWIAPQTTGYAEGREVIFAFCQNDMVLGAGGLFFNWWDNNAELGYWVGKLYWNHGVGTEAARALMDYGFNTVRLHRIHACVVPTNHGSRKVLQKLGMIYEGCFHEHMQQWGQYKDLEYYGLLRRQYLEKKR